MSSGRSQVQGHQCDLPGRRHCCGEGQGGVRWHVCPLMEAPLQQPHGHIPPLRQADQNQAGRPHLEAEG